MWSSNGKWIWISRDDGYMRVTLFLWLAVSVNRKNLNIRREYISFYTYYIVSKYRVNFNSLRLECSLDNMHARVARSSSWINRIQIGSLMMHGKKGQDWRNNWKDAKTSFNLPHKIRSQLSSARLHPARLRDIRRHCRMHDGCWCGRFPKLTLSLSLY